MRRVHGSNMKSLMSECSNSIKAQKWKEWKDNVILDLYSLGIPCTLFRSRLPRVDILFWSSLLQLPTPGMWMFELPYHLHLYVWSLRLWLAVSKHLHHDDAAPHSVSAIFLLLMLQKLAWTDDPNLLNIEMRPVFLIDNLHAFWIFRSSDMRPFGHCSFKSWQDLTQPGFQRQVKLLVQLGFYQTNLWGPTGPIRVKLVQVWVWFGPEVSDSIELELGSGLGLR